jgi:hypothetical protein
MSLGPLTLPGRRRPPLPATAAAGAPVHKKMVLNDVSFRFCGRYVQILYAVLFNLILNLATNS